MSTINLKLYDILRTEFNLSESKAKEVAVIVQETIEEEIGNKSRLYKSELREDMLKMEMHLKGEIKDSKADTIKWMFIFWVGSVGATLGGLIAIIRFMIAK